MLEIKNLSKTFRNFWPAQPAVVLDDVSLTLKKNEIVGLIGPNGAGKTTLIKILGLLLLPDRGQIFLNGREIFRGREKYLKKAGILLGEQSHYLYSGLSAEENLKLFASLKNIFGSESQKEIYFLAELLNFKEILRLKVREISSGYKKILALAIALLGRPEILLLDEPLSGVDPENAFYIRNALINLGRDRIILWASHNLVEVEKVCQKIHLLKKGRLIFTGNFGELGCFGTDDEADYLNELEKKFVHYVSEN